MTVLIVDDEPIARKVLLESLEEFPDVQIAGEAATGTEALERIQDRRPDLVLLDLHMPELDGISVARSLRGRRPPLVIFVTAFERHALEAFDSGAVDYLLKPVRHERLAAALQKARIQLAGLKPSPVARKKIVGRQGSDLHLLDSADVIAFQADGEIVHILTSRGKFLADDSLRVLEQRLEKPRFRRIHRKTIINTDHIRKISPLSSKRWLLKMSNGIEVVVSKRLARLVRDETEW